MELDNFIVSFLWTLAFVLLSQAVLQLIFKKKKELIHVIFSLVIIIILTYFTIIQFGYISGNFPESGIYALIAVLFATYVIVFIRIYSFINNGKLKKDKTVS